MNKMLALPELTPARPPAGEPPWFGGKARAALAALTLTAAPLWGGDPLSLRDAVRTALAKNKSLEAASASAKAAGTRVTQAKSGWLPKLNYAENFARSDNPVFVFSSLLTQQRFGTENFALGPLNHPDAMNNFQSQITLDQPIYDARQIRNATRSAELASKMTGEETRRAEMDVIAGVARAYYSAVLASESLATAREALRSAQADLERAEAMKSAGMTTDVDVLSIRVHLAAVEEQRIQRASDLDVARAALNDILGLPLETAHDLTTVLAPLDLPGTELGEYEKNALEMRPEIRETNLAASLARVQADAAKATFLPQVGARMAFESDRRSMFGSGGTNWLAAVSLKWNLFNGGADKARREEAEYGLRRAEADRERASSGARLMVRRAWADLRAAQQRIEVARAAMAEAAESLRITQNRYQAGLTNVTDLLRNETAMLASKTRYLAAVHDQRIAAATLQLSAGTLSADSEVLN